MEPFAHCLDQLVEIGDELLDCHRGSFAAAQMFWLAMINSWIIMGIHRALFAFPLFLVLPVLGAPSSALPTLRSSYPLGGTAGSSLKLALRGENLQGAYQVLFDSPAVQGQVESVDEPKDADEPKDTKDGNTPKKVQSVTLEVAISASAQPGAYSLRLVTPNGVSGPLWFVVNAEPAVAETEAKHDTLTDAQLLKVPVVVNGMLSKRGQLDYYAFDVVKGQELQFEVVTFTLIQGSVSADPILILYEPAKSWFSSQKGARLEVNDNSRPGLGDFSDVTAHSLPRLTRVFDKTGRYIAEVSTNQGEGGPDYSYQLRIVLVTASPHHQERWGPIVQAHKLPGPTWRKRTFPGVLEPDRIEQLIARGGAKTNLTLPSKIAIVREDEPNESPDRALEVPIPTIIEGTLDRPGDVDYFKFQVTGGQKLAFEIETPYLPPPFFNPRIVVFDASRKEVLENIFKSVGGDGDDWIKSIEPRVTYSFENSGEYRLKIQDLTTQLGGPNFVYRLLIRPQIAHLGKVEMRTDHINLAAGKSQRISVAADFEEGFEGDVALTVENLPPGVKVFPVITEVSEKPTSSSGKIGGEIDKERFRSQRQTTTLMFVAEPDAPLTKEPRMIELRAQPIVQGKAGRRFAVQQILLAVTPSAEASAGAERMKTMP